MHVWIFLSWDVSWSSKHVSACSTSIRMRPRLMSETCRRALGAKLGSHLITGPLRVCDFAQGYISIALNAASSYESPFHMLSEAWAEHLLLLSAVLFRLSYRRPACYEVAVLGETREDRCCTKKAFSRIKRKIDALSWIKQSPPQLSATWW